MTHSLSLSLLAATLLGTAQGEPLRVWVAASVAPVVEELALRFSRERQVEVEVNADATSRLATQIAQGAPAHLVVTADRRWMEWLQDEGWVDPGAERVLAFNRLVVVEGAPASSQERGAGEGRRGEPGDPPATVPRLREVLAGTPRLGVAGEEVPAGRYAREALSSAGAAGGAESRLVTGGSVRTVLEWVARGQVERGVVYATDARGDGRVRVAARVPAELHTPIEILAAPVRHEGPVGAPAPLPHPAHDLARDFLDLLTGPEGRAALRAGGFALPGSTPAAPRSPVSPTPGIDTGAAVRISVLVAVAATVLATLPALGLGWFFARHSVPGQWILSALILSPMVVPPVVTGVILLELLGRGSLLGRALAVAGVEVPFTFLAAVVAALVVGLPLYVLSVRNAFEQVDPRLEEVSRSLGSPPFRTFRRVSLPLALPGIAAGAVLAFARALGEFGATIVLAGNLEGRTRTIALAVYTLLERPEGAGQIWVLVGASVALSVLALAGYEILSRRQRARTRRIPGV